MTQKTDFLLDDFEASDEQIVVEENKRLDSFVGESFQISRSKASTLIEQGFVTVDGCCQKKSYVLTPGEKVNVVFPPNETYDVVAENIPIDIVYEDADLLVVNKPQGMVVHPAPGNLNGTLVNALMYHVKDLSGINGVLRPGIVHRIDKNTSGLLIVAKNDKSHTLLAEQIKAHSFDRYYEAVVHGTPKLDSGDIRYSIGRSRTDRKMMAAFDEFSTMPGVRHAVTHYNVLESYGRYSYVRLKLETGRTHQIRVHMKTIGHPIVGDDVYTSDKLEKFGLNGQCLHAKSIGFVHPTTGKYVDFDSELPPYFLKVLNILRRGV